MTEKELSRLFYLKKEAARLENEIKKLRDKIGYRCPPMTDMPKGGGRDSLDDVAALVDLERLLTEKKEKIEKERAKIEQFIFSVDDPEIRLIMRMRHIDCLTWERIGAELNMDRTNVSRVYRRFLKVAHKSH